jgi:hypothetical protein
VFKVSTTRYAIKKLLPIDKSQFHIQAISFLVTKTQPKSFLSLFFYHTKSTFYYTPEFIYMTKRREGSFPF